MSLDNDIDIANDSIEQSILINISLFYFEFQVIGEPCGYHGPYTFFKGLRIAPISLLEPEYHANSNRNNNCLDAIDRRTAELLRSNDTIIKSIKHEYNDSDSASESLDDLPLPRKFHKNETEPRINAGRLVKSTYFFQNE